MKGILPFVISNWLALEEESLQSQLGPRCQSIKNTENKKRKVIESRPRCHASTESLLLTVHSSPRQASTIISQWYPQLSYMQTSITTNDSVMKILIHTSLGS